MDFFDNYVSATTAGSGNQSFFITEDSNKIYTGRQYYKLNTAGKYEYSLLYSNILDSTFADGKNSVCNMICEGYKILSIKLGISKTSDNSESPVMHDVTFNGNGEKAVAPGEFFCTDPIMLSAEKNNYICIEITFCGHMIPNHEETLIPSYVMEDGIFEPSVKLPFPGMIGCKRSVKRRIGYWGDSITQGCGTDKNSYTHWCAKASESLGSDYSYWNLGLGFARSSDAVSKGAWAYKAIHNDVIVMCFGVNDLLNGKSAEEIINNISETVDYLNKHNVKVLVQTVPPFDMSPEIEEKRNRINEYILNDLKARTAVFDNTKILAENAEYPSKATYGGHPNGIGCQKWAEAIYPIISEVVKS